MVLKNGLPISLCAFLAACGGSTSAQTLAENDQGASNQVPVAVITADSANLLLNRPLQFNAGKSYDADGDALSYEWSLVRGVDSIPVALSQNQGAEVSVLLTDSDNYILTLTANDGQSMSEAASFEFTPEQTVIASAGRDVTVKQGQLVSLDGSASKSLDGVITGYKWQILSQPERSSARIFKDKRVKTAFVADQVGQYLVELKVENEFGDIATDTLQITSDALSENSAPVVVIKEAKGELKLNEVVSLDASESYDPDRFDRLTFTWQVLSQPVDADVTLSAVSGPQVSFSAATLGNYEVAVQVTDSKGEMTQAVYTFTVTTDNLPPIVELGSDSNVRIAPITLTCASCYDPEGELLTYQWQLQSRPAQSSSEILSATEASAQLNPDVAGEYVVALTVSDGVTAVTSKPRTFFVDDNQKPTAKISAPETVFIGEPVVLDATQSIDPNNDPLTFEWQVVDAASDIILQIENGKASFTPSVLGHYTVSVRANDGQYFSDPVTHTVNVTENLSPVITFVNENPRAIQLGSEAQFDASGSYDPEGDVLTYQWSLDKPAGSTAQLSADNLATNSLLADMAGNYTVHLQVSDSAGNTSRKSIDVTVTDPVSYISGTVTARLLNSLNKPVANAELNINGVQHFTDDMGRLNAWVEIEEGKALEVSTQDSRLASSTYTAPSITQDNFLVEMGDVFVAMLQPVEVNLYTCPQYTGPEVVEVGYRLVYTIPEISKLPTTHDQKVSFAIDQSGKATSSFSLPATAIYELYVDDSLKVISPTSTRASVFYSESIASRGFISICNKQN